MLVFNEGDVNRTSLHFKDRKDKMKKKESPVVKQKCSDKIKII